MSSHKITKELQYLKFIANYSSYFYCSQHIFTREEMVAFFLMVAKIWSQKNISSHGLGRKQFLVAQKWSRFATKKKTYALYEEVVEDF